jgi:hypothetical protein
MGRRREASETAHCGDVQDSMDVPFKNERSIGNFSISSGKIKVC